MQHFGDVKLKERTPAELYENDHSAIVSIRASSRKFLSGMIALSSAILTFSLSYSVTQDVSQVPNPELLELSWRALLMSIILAGSALFLEPRLSYVETSLKHQLRHFKIEIDWGRIKFCEKCCSLFIGILLTLYYLLIVPNSKIVGLGKDIFTIANISISKNLNALFGMIFIFELFSFFTFVLALLLFSRALL